MAIEYDKFYSLDKYSTKNVETNISIITDPLIKKDESEKVLKESRLFTENVENLGICTSWCSPVNIFVGNQSRPVLTTSQFIIETFARYIWNLNVLIPTLRSNNIPFSYANISKLNNGRIEGLKTMVESYRANPEEFVNMTTANGRQQEVLNFLVAARNSVEKNIKTLDKFHISYVNFDKYGESVSTNNKTK